MRTEHVSPKRFLCEILGFQIIKHSLEVGAHRRVGRELALARDGAGMADEKKTRE